MGLFRKNNLQYTNVGTGRTVILEQIKLYVVLALTGLFLLSAETTVFSHIRIPIGHMGKAAPSLGILFCMGVGFLFGDRMGGVTGLITGWLADATGGTGVMHLPLFYFLCGYLAGYIGKRRLAKNMPSFVVFAIGAGGMEILFQITIVFLQYRTLPPGVWILRGLFPVWILTVLFSPLVYGILWGEKKILNRNA